MTSPAVRHAWTALLFAACLGAGSIAHAQLQPGDPTPQLQFEAYKTRQQVDLQRLRNGFAVVHFFYASSAASKADMAHAARIRREFARYRVGLIGVAVDARPAHVDDAISKYGIDWPLAYNPQGGGAWTQAWQVPSSTYDAQWAAVVTPGGTIAWTGPLADLPAALPRVLGEHGVENFAALVPEKLAEELRAIQQLIEERKFSEAMPRLAAVPPAAAAADATTQALYDEAVAQVTELGEAALAEAEAMVEAGEFAEAVAHLNRIAEELVGTTYEQQARDRLVTLRQNPDAKKALEAAEREKSAAMALAAAQELEARGNTKAAIVRYSAVARLFAETAAAEEAKAALDRLDAGEGEGDSAQAAAERLFKLAESYAAAGRKELAREKYEQIVADYPNSRHAAEAQKALDKLQ